MKVIFEGFAFDASQNPPVYCVQEIGVDGSDLVHAIDGKIRAIVPVQHAPEYVSTGWVGDIGRENQDLRALRAMHNPPAQAPRKPPAIITGKRK